MKRREPSESADAAASSDRHAPLPVGIPAAPRVLVITPAAGDAELRAQLEAAGMLARGVRDVADAPEVARNWKPHALLVDAELGASAAADLIARTRKQHACSCILLVPAPTGEMVTLGDRCGADTILIKPIDVVVLRRHLVRDVERPQVTGTPTEGPPLPEHLVASSSPMRNVWRLVLLAAQSDSSVVLTGETGTGKEVFARALHRFSGRRGGPFVAINCAAIPENLIESELFGHERGSFTGATAQHKGKFELAHGGTLFLDEIGDLPLGLQVKLLRVLQERSFQRVGGTETIKVDVRVIAATHRQLDEEVQRARFRADLFYRLQVMAIRVPPLRERSGDIIHLWNSLIAEGASREGRAAPSTSTAVVRILLKHDWPGNIRELSNVAQHALTVATSDAIMPADLPEYLFAQTDRSRVTKGLVGMTLVEIEQAVILETCEALDTVLAAAQVLDISPRKIHYRLKEYKQKVAMSPRTAPAATAEASQTAEGSKRNLRVLLVEDDDDLRWALTDLLKDEGYEVLALSDGKVFLEHLGGAALLGNGSVPADLIITDIRMPGISGMQILEHARARGWAIPIIMITAYADMETRAQAKRLGAPLLDKPIDIATLQRVIAGSVN